MPKKIKVFLGAYINQTNAQNLNCRTLAEHLDKNRFEVFTLTIAHGNLGNTHISNVNIFECKYPVKLTQYLGFFWGIWKSDIAYLPRGNNFRLQKFFVRLLRRKSFKTIENIMDEEVFKTAFMVLKNIDIAKKCYSFTDRLYSMTHFMRQYNLGHHGLFSESALLPPVINTLHFRAIRENKSLLRRVVFIGNDMKRKRVDEFIVLARHFSHLEFHVIGKDDGGFLSNLIERNGIPNLKVHGMLRHDQMLEVLKDVQVHLLLSRSEGFPKGIIECASAGIPSIVYGDYGANEWIENFRNGVVCENITDIETTIQELISTPNLLKQMSEGAIELAEKFREDKVTNMYEREIISLHEE